MGTQWNYQCAACGYSAQVSGGRGCGFVAVVRTMACKPCRALFDVPIGAYGREGPTGDPEFDRKLGACPSCGGRELRPWKKGDSCPRCGGSMEQDPDSLCMWD